MPSKFESVDGVPIDTRILTDALRLRPKTATGALRAAQISFLSTVEPATHAAIEEAFAHPADANLTVAEMEGSKASGPKLSVVVESPEAAHALFGNLPGAVGMETKSMIDTFYNEI